MPILSYRGDPSPTISKVTPAEAQGAPVETSEAEIKANNEGSEQGSGDSLRPSNGLAKINIGGRIGTGRGVFGGIDYRY